VGLKVGLVGSEKSSVHRVSNPRPSSPCVATPTTPFWSRNLVSAKVRSVKGGRTASLKRTLLIALLELRFLERESCVCYYC